MVMMVTMLMIVVVVEADWCRGCLGIISPQLGQSLRRLVSPGVAKRC